MGKRLGEVPEVTSGLGVKLFSKKSERARGTNQLLTLRSRSIKLADFYERRHEPKRTDRKGPLRFAIDAVVGCLRSVSIHDRTVTQIFGDRHDRGTDALILWRKKSHER